MKKIRILWTDDEVEALKPHIIFLEEKGYEVLTCSNGTDTVDLIGRQPFDILFLDENMPGLSGMETLRLVREAHPDIPVVMVTKSDEEELMEAAIGSEIADYLIKPVKPKQVLLSIKKIVDQRRLVTEKTTTDYQVEFGKIGNMISSAGSFDDWCELYKKIVFWEGELSKSTDSGMAEILYAQENEANNIFAKFVSKNYLSWLQPGNSYRPVMSDSLMKEKVFPRIDRNRPLFFVLIDNMRYDQWRAIASSLAGIFRVVDEELFCGILPTSTQFSRNAIFSGLMPSEIKQYMPNFWIEDDEEVSKNYFEEELFANHLSRKGINIKWSYHRINKAAEGKRINDKLNEMMGNDLNILVYNFVDILSHARTEIDVIRDLANEEPAYRSLTMSWFQHSSLLALLKTIASENVKVIFATDHGTIRVQNPIKVVGDKSTSPNLRYKMGRNLAYNPKEVFEITDPLEAFLPKSNISSKYIFATNKDFFVYQNNFNHYAAYYKNTFQHGGISMQEMLLPVAYLEPV
jgi:CheY-like chemotaxis protein